MATIKWTMKAIDKKKKKKTGFGENDGSESEDEHTGFGALMWNFFRFVQRGLQTGSNQRWKKLLAAPFCITGIIYISH